MAQSNPNLNDIFTDTANAIRAKTKKAELIHPVDFADEIDSIETGGSIEGNIHFSSTTAPEDTTKLWVKTNTSATKVVVSKTAEKNLNVDQLSITMPSSLYGSGAAYYNGKIYIFGGTGSNASSKTDVIHRYDISSDRITTLSTRLPQALFTLYSSCVTVGNNIYIFGGYGQSTVSTIYKFNATNEFISTLSATLPNSGIVFALAVGTNIYVFGDNTTSIYKFDTTTDTITTLSTTLPAKINANGGFCFLVGGYIYIYKTSSYDGWACKFKVDTETVVSLEYPSGSNIERFNPVVGALNGKVYLLGGYYVSTYYRNALEFDPSTETFTATSDILPTTINKSAYVCYDEHIYYFGGKNGSGASAISNNGYVVNLSLPLQQSNLLIVEGQSQSSFNLVNNDNMVISISPLKTYIGNSSGQGEEVTSALYDGSSWVNID